MMDYLLDCMNLAFMATIGGFIWFLLIVIAFGILFFIWGVFNGVFKTFNR